MAEKLIGKVIHYFDKIGVAVVKIDKGNLAVGDTIHILRGERDFQQQVESLQVEKEQVNKIKSGEEAGMKVDQPVKPGDAIYKI
ncbi:MAG: hypothetical protein COV55_02500 [Candidatus Komeilibacteria bacterium CG11_big_fil_rev_8_21_14_0_20_36_20]|uniref:Translation elongation factor-like protein n=1 Tax=Candidatus Komeilibacteria bacterium CG11_big_fil_rev_8_21_14_0_20_36_20 TaxID=1974477 RepID=A0A2H0ND49_9BACT|nr:MAG: hypothetical protein COV55_02500 [Candidatus Komeilibacteria bacterium CG11_big_fil_rev_8_21_14_0_20_36_20]PIR81844.1 MAG: hypothetical protein COU21_01560 [Candidatus Komeilibacteria bacterium CG10_big_fil_rev_8_21_14_0_10_36_65]PJC55335.1 MAG: hypothetical protein CO027_02900 [Candidatus Komeilibacteria bacterium CG_4_9_14_0_2_um_filter_36_13]